ncbi:MAG: M28 family peptidase [Fimbriiglobus sp.]
MSWFCCSRGSRLAAAFAIGLISTLWLAAEDAPAPRDLAKIASEAVVLDKKILAEVASGSEVMVNLKHLSDVIGPRVTGSKNLEIANNWTAEKMKSYGLENVRLEPWEIPVGWERGTATMKLVEPNNGRSLLVASRAWAPGTKGKLTAEVLFVDLKTKADMAKYKGKLKGKVIMREAPTTIAPITDMSYGPGGTPPKKDDKKDDKAAPKKDTPPSANEPPRASFAELQALRRELDDLMKSEGAIAVLSDSRKPHGLLVTTGGWREGDRGTPQDPLASLYLAHEHYAMLHRLATRPDAKPPVVEIEISNTFVPGPITVFNTVGEIRGSEKPDEIVVVGAHLDSWDLASGTTDNGTGSSVVLEVARTLGKLAQAGQRPKRTIRFVLFSGEEQGLYGSRRYCDKHKDTLAKHSVALVHDTGTGFVRGFGLQGREAVRKVLAPELESLKVLPGWEGLDLGGVGGTDHLSFEGRGVPGFACRQDMDEYRLTHHTQTDTFDKAKEPNLKQGASAIAVTAMRVANLAELLPRDKPETKRNPKGN